MLVEQAKGRNSRTGELRWYRFIPQLHCSKVKFTDLRPALHFKPPCAWCPGPPAAESVPPNAPPPATPAPAPPLEWCRASDTAQTSSSSPRRLPLRRNACAHSTGAGRSKQATAGITDGAASSQAHRHTLTGGRTPLTRFSPSKPFTQWPPRLHRARFFGSKKVAPTDRAAGQKARPANQVPPPQASAATSISARAPHR